MIKEKELNDDLETIKIGRQYTSLEEVRDVILDLARSNQVAIEITLDTDKNKGDFQITGAAMPDSGTSGP